MFFGKATLLGRIASTLAIVAIAFVAQPAWAQDVQPGVAIQPGVELQTRGPIHEAFAEATGTAPAIGLVVSKQPPEPVNEIPPDVKPDGDVIWIPGYWAWDDERNDFLWVSGVWRVPPPNATWVPGYWAQAEGGFQWVPGFWTGDEQLQYFPAPPTSLEAGPTSPPPGDDFFYVPGQWIMANGQYAWQPGYWAPYQQGWVWTNSQYVWTPSGYVYVPGRWDYPFAQRGVMFAPATFNQGVYSQPGFAYRPSLALNVAMLASMMFARPNYGSYYYGDYYGQNYQQAGYQPWYAYQPSGFANTMYGYERWSRRTNDPNWDQRVRQDYDTRLADTSARPPRNWNQWQERYRNQPQTAANNGPSGTATVVANQTASVFLPVDQAAKQNFAERKWTAVPADAKAHADGMSRHVRELTDQRRQAELKGGANGKVSTGVTGLAAPTGAVAPGGQAATTAPAATAAVQQPEARPSFRLPQGPQLRTTAKPIEGGAIDPARGDPARVQAPPKPQAPTAQQPTIPHVPGVGQAPAVRQSPVVQQVPKVQQPVTPQAPQGVLPGVGPRRGNEPKPPVVQPSNPQPKVNLPPQANNPVPQNRPEVKPPQSNNNPKPSGPPPAGDKPKEDKGDKPGKKK